MNNSTPPRHLFLDLEDTIITPVMEGWANTELINVELIKGFIDQWQPTNLHIFSFAIHSTWDLARFKDDVQPRIEVALGRPLEIVPLTQDNIFRQCCKVKKIAFERVSFSDVSDFWGKHDSFKLYVRALFAQAHKPVEVALLDDAVEDEDFCFPSLGISGVIRNIEKM